MRRFNALLPLLIAALPTLAKAQARNPQGGGDHTDGRAVAADEPQKRGFRPIELPEPETVVREDRLARAHTRHYTGRPPMLVGPGLRVAPGFSGRVTGDPSAAYTMDFVAGGRIGLHPGDEQWVWVPEVGYSWRTPGKEHLLMAGLGFGRGEGESSPPSDARAFFGGFSYVPRFVLDLSDDERAYGLRHGLMWDFSENTIALEVAHQMLRKHDEDWHELRVSLSVDLGLVALMLALD